MPSQVSPAVDRVGRAAIPRPPATRRAGLAAALLAALLLASCAMTSPPAAPSRSAAVLPRPLQLWRGAGMALAWEANLVYGSPRVTPVLPHPVARAEFMDLLYGDPARGPGLGLNVVRYNIGGGGDPDTRACDRPPDHGLQPTAAMQGFRVGPGRPYDWSRDASQRRMLRDAIARGADILEAFSNSAPWWMTVSGCVGGADHPRENNLRADAVPAFAVYLATVTRHFARRGIRFESVSPVNEPDGAWWVAGNHQEGSFATPAMQSAIIAAVAADLRGTGTIVSGTEPNDFDAMTSWLARMDGPTLAALGRVNVHQYAGRHPAALRLAVRRLGKPLWASEVGCCLVPESASDGALDMADAIREAMVDLGAEVWCFWQPDWGVIGFDRGRPRPERQFYAIAQYTRFIRPGDRILAVRGEGIAAAATPDGRRVVVVVINRSRSAVEEDIDLSALGLAGRPVRVFRTVVTGMTGLVPSAARIDATGRLLDREPGSSVTTYVVGGDA